MTRIVCFTTGGTIASTWDEAAGGFIAALSGEALVQAVERLHTGYDLEVVELSNVSSTFLTPEQVFSWTQRVADELSRPEVDGAVVAHGTDTLEESAYLFDLTLTGDKPVVFTGAMRTPSESITDGTRNLLCAVRVAAHADARSLGVLVVLNEQIHAARDVTKSHAEGLDSFISPNLGPLGNVSRGWHRDDVILARRPLRREHVATERIESRVAYVKTVLGTGSEPINSAIGDGARGIVIESFAGGEVTPYMCEGIMRAVNSGAEVVVATRALRGRPLDL